MIACLDVDYRDTEVVAAGVGILEWSDAAPYFENVTRSKQPAAPYQPGKFYERELPWLLKLLATMPDVDLVVIDGYVWLGKERAGLGAHLHQALASRYPIVGVAKGTFRDNDCAIAVARGGSARPLFVTAVGVTAHWAAERVAGMHGEHRIPTILKRADRLARDS